MTTSKRWDGPPVETWERAWTPDQAAAALAGVAAPWAVAGGWALDLWRGERTRSHGDLEIAVTEGGYPEVQGRLEGLGLALYGLDDGAVIAMAPGETPAALRGHQTWAADPVAGEWRMDVFREPGDEATWVYRRTGALSAPRAWAVGRTAAGVPYLAPQIVLLFKAKHLRDKDVADFVWAAPALSDEARGWLVRALEVVEGAEHPWIGALAGMGTPAL